MSHEEYVEKNRSRVGVVARGMLDGSIDYLEGSVELASLRFEVEVSEHDKDFLAFVGVSSEIDHLPIGEARKQWSKEALQCHGPDIKNSTEWAKSVSLAECKSMAERFNA